MANPMLKTRRFTSRSGAVIDFTELGFGTAPLGNLYRAISEEDAQASGVDLITAGLPYDSIVAVHARQLAEGKLDIDRSAILEFSIAVGDIPEGTPRVGE